MKTNQAPSAVLRRTVRSLLLGALAVQLSLPALAQTPTSGAPAAAPSENSVKSAAFYDCLHMNKSNYFWTMYLSKSLPQTVTSNMTVDQILEHSGPESMISQLIVDSAQKSLSRFIRKSIEKSTSENFNLTTEFTNNLRLFGRYLRMRLKQAKNINFKSPIEFELMFAPRMSEVLMDRKIVGIGTRKSIYPMDRVLVAEPVLDNDLFKSYDVEKGDLSLDGIQALMREALSCGEQAKIHQAYPVSIILKMVITPDIDNSKISAQFVAGMPTGQSVPFAQANPQITFQSIKLPNTVQDTPEDKGNLPLLMANHFPVAIIDVSATLDSSVIPIEIRMGTLGALTGNGWQLSNIEGVLTKRLPKLVGIPGDAASTSVAEKIKRGLLTEFNIAGLVLEIDYTKYGEKRAVEVEELDLLISAGLNRFPNFTVGQFSVKSVNEQFRTEINKTIAAQIDAQEAALKKKVEDAKQKASEHTGLKPEQIDGMLKVLFSKNTPAAVTAAGQK